MTGHTILIVDDEQSICDVLSVSLRRAGYDVLTETDPVQALQKIQQDGFDVIIIDIVMPQMDGLTLFSKINQIKKDIVVIILTAYSTWDRAVEAMRLGAFDLIKKPFDIETDIKPVIEKALYYKLHKDQYLQRFAQLQEELGLIFGYSKQMKDLKDIIIKAAGSDANILIQGESGVGKELVAKALHYCSHRSAQPFVAVNCGAIVETLLESELFGHVKGAFTGAISDKVGLVEYANHGTLFLDEISEMSPGLQVKLLRLIEEKEYKPVGSPASKKADIRIISATNRQLLTEVKAGRFRSDLYYRINVIPIEIAPLRERKEDIPLLAESFLKKFASLAGKSIKGFSSQVKKAFEQYPWPGNVRELQNVIQRAVALASSDIISQVELPYLQQEPVQQQISDGFDLDARLAEVEKGYILKALEMTGGNYTRAAKILNISLRSLMHRMKKYKIR